MIINANQTILPGVIVTIIIIIVIKSGMTLYSLLATIPQPHHPLIERGVGWPGEGWIGVYTYTETDKLHAPYILCSHIAIAVECLNAIIIM